MAQEKRLKRPRAGGLISPKRLAAAIGVSESSLKRWSDEGLLQAQRTVGGHRRIEVAEAVRFVRERGLSLVRPELLGLTAMSAGSAATREGEVTERLFGALASDRAAEARSLVVSLYVEGATLGWLFDGPVRAALARVGELWEHDEAGIFLEHRATETCLQALAELRQLLPSPGAGAPVAVGGGGSGDVYRVPSAMAALVLAEAGYEVRNLGPDTPVEAVLAAIRHYHPRLVWQSFSVVPRSTRDAAAGLVRLAEAAGSGSVVIGGRGSHAVPLPPRLPVHRVDSMAELSAFARGAAVPAAGTRQPAGAEPAGAAGGQA
jgi:MerR family transcriptional regulator, light-induced transcriptional regulator